MKSRTHPTPPEVIEQIKELKDQGLGLSAIARKLDKPKSTVHRALAKYIPQGRLPQNSTNSKSVAMGPRKPKGQTLKADAPVDASRATVTRIELPSSYGRFCNAAQRAPYVPRELSYRGRA